VLIRFLEKRGFEGLHALEFRNLLALSIQIQYLGDVGSNFS
jgi:hypothetical protein